MNWTRARVQTPARGWACLSTGAERSGHISRGREPLIRPFPERPLDNAAQAWRYRVRQCWNGLIAVGTQGLDGGTPSEGHEARQHLVKDDAERVQVCTAVDVRPHDGFRCEVVGCAR